MLTNFTEGLTLYKYAFYKSLNESLKYKNGHKMSFKVLWQTLAIITTPVFSKSSVWFCY